MRINSRLSTALLTLLLGIGAGDAIAGEYLVKDITTVAPGAYASALNDQGDVAGMYDWQTKGFIYNVWSGELDDVYTASFAPFYSAPTYVKVWGMSAYGDIAGTYGSPNGPRAFKTYFNWPDKMIDLGQISGAGWRAEGRGVEKSGRVVGSAEVGTEQWHAFLYEGNTMRDLGTFGGQNSHANAINDHWVVTGCAENLDQQAHAFRFTHGIPGAAKVDLGTLGGVASCGKDINSRNQIVGWSAMPGGGAIHAFLHDGTQMIDLGARLPAGSSSFGIAINNRGDVIGNYTPPGGSQRAFLYRLEDDTMWDLEDVAPPGVEVFAARDINNAGQILVGGHLADKGFRELLLTPPVLERLSYAFAGQPTTALYSPPAADAYNGAGGPIVIKRHGVGDYEVQFHDYTSWTPELSSAVAVTAHGPATTTCSATSYTHLDEGGAYVRVSCVDLNLQTMSDSAFSVMITGNQSLEGPSAFMQVLDAVAPTVNKYFSWSSTAIAPMSVTRTGTGTYNLLLGTGNTAKSAKLVTARWGGGVTCMNAKGISGGLTVKCHDLWGNLVNSAFSVVQVAGGRPGYRTGFARANLSTTASYTPAAETSHNSSGGAITATRSAVGRYRITFAGLAQRPGARQHIQVSSFAENLRIVCNSTSWLNQGDDLVIGVECRNTFGQYVDTRYDVLAIE